MCDDFKFPELTDRSRLFLWNVSEFVKSKRLLDNTAKVMLPQKKMDEHSTFDIAALLVQKNLLDEKVNCLDELLAAAGGAEDNFNSIMENLVLKSTGMDPLTVVTTKDGQRVMRNPRTPFTVLTVAPLKGRDRMQEKVDNELGGCCWRILDVVRCSVIVFTEDQLSTVAWALKDHCHTDEKSEQARKQLGENDFLVVRLKNRFKEPLYRGHRDALYNIVVKRAQVNATHVCEVQLHLAELMAHKERTHVFYEYFRSCFGGSGEEEKRMKALQNIQGCEGNVDLMIATILQGSDLDQLRDLASLIDDLMGDVKITVLIRARILELDGSLPSRQNYGRALLRAGRLDEAENTLRESLRGMRQELGNSDPRTLNSVLDFAAALKDGGKLNEAEPLCREALDGMRKHLGDAHLDTLASISNFASLLQNQGKLDAAEKLYREALEGRKKNLEEAHPDILESTNKLAQLLQLEGKLPEAELLFKTALDGSRKRLGNLHPDTLTSSHNLAALLNEQGKPREAAPLFRETLDGRRSQLGDSHPDTQASIYCLASLLRSHGELSEAEPLLREALEWRRKQFGNKHRATVNSMNELASLLRARGKLAEAEPCIRWPCLQRGKNLATRMLPH